MSFKEHKTGQVIRFPVEKSGKPPDAIEVFRRKQRREKETGVEIGEPDFLKNISDTKVIENIIIKEYGVWYKQSYYKEVLLNQISDKPATFRLIRKTLKEPDSMLEESRADVDIIKSYIDFLVTEFIKTLDHNDLLSNAELYKYAGAINEKVAKKKLFPHSTIKGTYTKPIFELNSQFHFLAGELYETLSEKEKNPDKKADFIHEAISEYLGQILIYELQKELSQEEFDLHVKSITRQDTKDNIAKDLAMTLESYDARIKALTDKVLKLSKIKS